MTADELFDLQPTWASRGLSALREVLPLMSPVGRVKHWTPEEQGTLGELLAASARSSESALHLCVYGKLWDADVISRCVVEGSLKFIYLLQSREHFKQRYQEYANDLFQIGLFKDHKRVESLLAVLPDPDAAQWQPFRDLLLTPSTLDSTNKRYGRVKRRELGSR